MSQDVAFQERDWRAQAVGQLLVLAFVIAGILGLFGGGWLGAVTTTDPLRQLEVEYSRFARADSPYHLTFRLAPELVRAETVELWMESKILETLTVESVTPESSSQSIRGDRVIFTFSVTDATDVVPVVFRVKAREAGRSRGQAGVVGGPSVELSHFVYP